MSFRQTRMHISSRKTRDNRSGARNLNPFNTISYGSGPDKVQNIWNNASTNAMGGRSSFVTRRLGLATAGAGAGAGGVGASFAGKFAGAEDDEENIADKYSSAVAACKADIFMLQMRHDKLVRYIKKTFNKAENASRAGLQSPKSVTLGESAIQDVLKNCVNTSTVLRNWKSSKSPCLYGVAQSSAFNSVDEGLVYLAIQNALHQLVSRKVENMQETFSKHVQSLVLSGARASNAKSSARPQVKAALSSADLLLRLLTRLHQLAQDKDSLDQKMTLMAQQLKHYESQSLSPPKAPSPEKAAPSPEALARELAADLPKLQALVKADTTFRNTLGEQVNLMLKDDALSLAEAQARANEATAARDAAMKELSAATDTIAKRDEELKKLRARLADADTADALAEARGANEGLQQQVSTLTAALEAERKLVSEAEAKLKEMSEKQSQAPKDDKLSAANARLLEENRAMRLKVQAASAECRSLRARVKKIETLNEDQHRNLTARYEGKVRALEQLRAQLDLAQAQLTDAEAEKRRLQGVCNDLKAKIKEMQRAAAERSGKQFDDTFEEIMQEEFDALRDSYAVKIKNLEKEVKTHKLERQKALRKQSQEHEKETKTLNGKLRRLELRRASLEADVQSWKQAAEDASNKS